MYLHTLIDPCQAPEDEYARPFPLKGIPKTPIVLFQYEVCPFCCKAKAALDFYKVRFWNEAGRLDCGRREFSPEDKESVREHIQS